MIRAVGEDWVTIKAPFFRRASALEIFCQSSMQIRHGPPNGSGLLVPISLNLDPSNELKSVHLHPPLKTSLHISITQTPTPSSAIAPSHPLRSQPRLFTSFRSSPYTAAQIIQASGFYSKVGGELGP